MNTSGKFIWISLISKISEIPTNIWCGVVIFQERGKLEKKKKRNIYIYIYIYIYWRGRVKIDARADQRPTIYFCFALSNEGWITEQPTSCWGRPLETATGSWCQALTTYGSAVLGSSPPPPPTHTHLFVKCSSDFKMFRTRFPNFIILFL